ncbi:MULTISPECIES: AraC family transcriptional regulator [unclassified Acidovorax]|uniref:AraC family transcriptional regulator n=1 Tax=unclassified Acidovorax TaxID=2684926 RepID=UPI001C47304D|nr:MULTISPECIES: AraC family transcriptional regulator [unclassified Acidovorax]MBV7429345.1 AraC family transcriptional regulator [Acidovorax sp. sif0732]MBV7451171.1 AraC family transcriptional regulator [Acidovorax sp. sif0715]
MQIEKQVLEWLICTPGLVESLLDGMPEALFYIKDKQGRYLWANKTLLERAGLDGLQAVVGRTADQLFPTAGANTMVQDMQVIHSGYPSLELLRLYRGHKGERHWCLSSKFPLLDTNKRIVGLAGISRDLPRANERHRSYHRLAKFLAYIDERLDQSVRIADAAGHASVSMDTLNRLVFEVFHVTPKQYLMKRRIDKACQMLEETSVSITGIAAACGYADHSAFSRQFKAATHITPAQYRATHKTAPSS